MTALYKVLVDGKSCHGGDFTWSLPTGNNTGGWTPGDWHEISEEPLICVSGFHLTTSPMDWPAINMQVFEAEGGGAISRDHEGDDKTAFQRARLLIPRNDLIPDWWKSAESFVESLDSIRWMRPDGNPDPSWVVLPDWSSAAESAAARSAVRSAAESAAWSAARSAAESAAARSAAESAAWSAARSAAWSAAWSAARSAAESAAESAARSAVRSAAWSAAESAAESAALEARMILCDDLGTVDPLHREYIRRRMEVWEKGYLFAGDVDGVFYAAVSLSC